MKLKQLFGVVVIGMAVSLLFSGPALAKKRATSGSYTGRKGGTGTFQKEVSREPGKKTGNTTWQNERGTGSRQSERTWDKNAGTGAFSSTTTGAAGKTFERSGTVTKTGENTYSVNGTVTGPNGRTMDVNKTVEKTETGRTVTGDYSTSGGKSGTFATDIVRDGSGGWDRHTAVTNQDGKTGTQDVDVTRDGSSYTRTVTNTRPNGETNTGTGTFSIDNVTRTKE